MTNQVEENLKERGALLMKQYQDVLIILGENATAQSKFNKLLKIQTKTVDKQLAYLIDEVRKAYNYYVPPRSSRRVELGSGIPSNHGEYLEYLMPIYKKHGRNNKDKDKDEIGVDDSDFQRFVRGQLLWDRAMAQALYSALNRQGRPLVVGIMGAGHIRYGYGVPHQLMDLGIEDVAMLLPWESNKACEQLVTGIADAVFGVASYADPHLPQRQRLGIRFEMVQKGAHILQIKESNVAETAGLINEDIITEIAGLEVRQINDVIEAVQRQAPGTWLPLRVTRGSETIEIIAKFSVVMQ